MSKENIAKCTNCNFTMCDDSIKDKLICLNDYSVMYGELVHKEGVCPKHKFVGKRSINNE